MWGMAGWTGSDDEESRQSLDRAVELGCNFFDTAWAYGDGKSEQLLGELLQRHPDKRLHVATKIPPKNRQWPARPQFALDDVFPADYIREYTEISLENLGVDDDRPAAVPRLDRRMGGRRPLAAGGRLAEGRRAVRAIGISINRWQPANVLKALATDLIDSVQVVYNIFDQSPEDELFPECRAPQHRRHRAGAVRRRQPDGHADAGRDLARGRLPQHLLPARESAQHARARGDVCSPLVPEGMSLAGAGAASYPADAGGQHRDSRACASCGTSKRTSRASDSEDLPDSLMAQLKGHRWDRWIDIP